MKRIILATAGVAVVAVFAATLGSAQPTATTGCDRHAGRAEEDAAAAAGRGRRAEALEHRRQVRLAAVRLHRRPGQERRLRRRDREVVLPLRVRPVEPRVTFTCATTPAREPALTDGPRRPRDRDVHVHGRPRHADRLLACLLQGDRSPARSERLARSSRLADLAGKTVATTSGSIYDRWIKQLLPADRSCSSPTSFTNALLAFRDGRADTLMWDDTVLLGIAVADPTAEAHGRPVPAAPVRDRDEAGQHGDEALGRLAAEPHDRRRTRSSRS